MPCRDLLRRLGRDLIHQGLAMDVHHVYFKLTLVHLLHGFLITTAAAEAALIDASCSPVLLQTSSMDTVHLGRGFRAAP